MLTATASATAPLVEIAPSRSLWRSGCAVGGKPPLRAGGALAALGALAPRETSAASPLLAAVL
jgi:hypothetical protein